MKTHVAVDAVQHSESSSLDSSSVLKRFSSSTTSFPCTKMTTGTLEPSSGSSLESQESSFGSGCAVTQSTSANTSSGL